MFAPFVHKYSYRLWSRRSDKSKQRMCLQYAMWTLAVSLSSQFQFIRNSLYSEVRQLLEALESDVQSKQADPSLYSISIEQVQAWILVAIYELTSDTCNYQRGIMSAGRAFRLVQIMRLHEIDKPTTHANEKKAQGDWVDTESKRRTFWLAYTIDRFTGIVDGLHLAFDERHVRDPA